MSQHYTRNTSQVKHWCPTCKRHTMHAVYDRRLSNCLEHGASGMSKAQEAAQKKREEAEKQPGLFSA